MGDKLYIYDAADGSGRKHREHFPNRGASIKSLDVRTIAPQTVWDSVRSFPSKWINCSGTYYKHACYGRICATVNWEEPANKSSSNWMRFVCASLQCHAHIAPQHIDMVRTLCYDDYPQCVEVARWYLHEFVAQPEFPSWILFTYDADFTQDGVISLENMHVWAHENRRSTRVQSQRITPIALHHIYLD